MEHCPNCRSCAHFQVTFDPKQPVGCRKFGFKCRQMPSLEVLATTGSQCIFHEPKQSFRQIAEVPAYTEGTGISYVA